jgi:hypothetical protein
MKSQSSYTLLPRLLGLGEKGEGSVIHIVPAVPLLRVPRLTTRKDGGSCLPFSPATPQPPSSSRVGLLI